LVQVDGVANDLDGDVHRALNLRRARLGVAGELFPSIFYSLNFELGGAVDDERRRLNNLWLEYRGFGSVRLRAGLFAPSQPFEGPTPGLLFLERAAPASVQRSLAGGNGAKALAVFANGSRWTASAGLSSGSIYGSPGRDPLAANARYSVIARNAQPLVHLGGNATWGIHAAAGQARFSERGETRSTSRKLVDSGLVDARGAWAVGFEAGAQWRRFFAQTEYYRFGIQTASPPALWYSGWYLLAAWTVVGEPRRYRVSNGSFDSPRSSQLFRPRRGDWGALEVAARYSQLNLEDGGGSRGASFSSAIGGDQRVLSIVFNWYPDEHVRVQAGLQQIETRSSEQRSDATPDFRLLSLRTQFVM